MIRSYQKLIVWKEAHALRLWTYALTRKFPADERFALVSQMRRSAYSVPMNVAEGADKKSIREREKFYEISSSSLEELHYQFLPAKDLHYIDEKEFHDADDRIQRTGYLLSRLRKAL